MEIEKTFRGKIPLTVVRLTARAARRFSGIARQSTDYSAGCSAGINFVASLFFEGRARDPRTGIVLDAPSTRS